MDAWDKERQFLWDDISFLQNLILDALKNEEWNILRETCKRIIAKAEHIIATCFNYPPPDPQASFHKDTLLQQAMLEYSRALAFFATSHLGCAFANVKQYYGAMDENYNSSVIPQFKNAVEIAKKCMEAVPSYEDKICIENMLKSKKITQLLQVYS